MEKPVLYAGGVMANSMAQEQLSARFGGYFAKPNILLITAPDCSSCRHGKPDIKERFCGKRSGYSIAAESLYKSDFITG